ncbi:FGGY family carbohydrate kinase [Gordonia humi]|uniref:Xylulose kinase n=1 Tax=Gordonia humi TaxID=686429 RepID=A0A840EUX0_9ACTN|nr:FGGY family carbohydrate kinase [Gordonia humi]MBB4133636.1 xylulokinase [Gordonia humi]
MTLVAGVDSSTQSCKVLICDAETGAIVRTGAAVHPSGTQVSPEHWWTALTAAIDAAGGFDDVAAVSVGGQQHGMVCLDADGGLVRDAVLWNDTRSAQAAADLVGELGGADEWAKAVGVVPLAAITVSKLRWLADREPENADRTAAVCLPHDWLTWKLRGFSDLRELTTDRSDASGTGYFSAATGEYRYDLLELAFGGRQPLLPRVIGPAERAGVTAVGAVVGAGAGDNAAAALGLHAGPGDAVVSMGTSGVVSAVTDVPPCDASGLVAGFADATGRHLPLVCTLNGAPVLASTAKMLGVDLDEFSRLALAAPAGADGITLIPYFAGERSPNLPDATGSISGITAANFSPANIARAAVEGLLGSLVFCRERIEAEGIGVRHITLTGGGSKSPAVQQVAASLFGGEVTMPDDAEYVALGAARQAAWALTGELPVWTVGSRSVSGEATPEVYEQYRMAAEGVAR